MEVDDMSDTTFRQCRCPLVAIQSLQVTTRWLWATDAASVVQMTVSSAAAETDVTSSVGSETAHMDGARLLAGRFLHTVLSRDRVCMTYIFVGNRERRRELSELTP